jgi:hypothetical protein
MGWLAKKYIVVNLGGPCVKEILNKHGLPYRLFNLQLFQQTYRPTGFAMPEQCCTIRKSGQLDPKPSRGTDVLAAVGLPCVVILTTVIGSYVFFSVLHYISGTATLCQCFDTTQNVIKISYLQMTERLILFIYAPYVSLLPTL